MITELRAAAKAVARANRWLERRSSKVPEIDALIDDVANDACVFCGETLHPKQLQARRRPLVCTEPDCQTSYYRCHGRWRRERVRKARPCAVCGGLMPKEAYATKRYCGPPCHRKAKTAAQRDARAGAA